MKVLKEAFITKTTIDEIVSAAEKHPVAIERLKKIRDSKKERDFEALINEMYPNGIGLENLFDLLENDIDLVEDELGVKFESMNESRRESADRKTVSRYKKRIDSCKNLSELQKIWDEADDELDSGTMSGETYDEISYYIVDVSENRFGYKLPIEESLTEASAEDVERKLERAKSAGDDTQAWDLAMCIENDEDIYNRFITPAIKNLQRKAKRGIYDRTLAVQLFYYVVENSLKYGPRWFPYKLQDVTVPTRYLAADELVDFFEDEFTEKE